MRILVYVSDGMSGSDLEQLVRDRGHQIAGVARTPSEAIAIAKATKPSLALISAGLDERTSSLALIQELSMLGVPGLLLSTEDDRDGSSNGSYSSAMVRTERKVSDGENGNAH